MTTGPWVPVVALGLHEHRVSGEGLRPPGAGPLSWRRTLSTAGEGGALCPELVQRAPELSLPLLTGHSRVPCGVLPSPHSCCVASPFKTEGLASGPLFCE